MFRSSDAMQNNEMCTTDPPSKQNMISEYSFYVSISHRISMYPTLGAVWWPEGGWEDVVVIISL